MTTPRTTSPQSSRPTDARRSGKGSSPEGQPRPTNSRLLTKDEERALILQAQSGDDRAMEELVQRNEGLIGSIIKRYADPVDYPFEDALQDGRIGLIEAIRKFDLSTSYKLSTYATHWIRQAVTRGRAATATLIRIPIHVKERVQCIRKAENSLRSTLNREPTQEEIAHETGLTVKKVKECEDLPTIWVSLDTPISLLGGCNYGELDLLVDFIADPVPGPESDARLAEFDLKQVVRGVLDLVDAKTEDLLRRRYGLPPYHSPQTFDEIAAEVGVTRQRVEQRVKKALSYLREALGMSEVEKVNRNEAIVGAIAAGKSVETVALQFNIQPRRVLQITREARQKT